MTAPYQVFVDGPKDRSAAAVTRLAAAMGARYGLAPADLASRLTRGRFKVKAGVDRATAEQYARDLERLGAICTIVDATGATVDLTAPVPAPARTSSLPPPRGSSLPPRTGVAALPPQPARAASGPLPGALASARAGVGADLGALGRDDGSIALSSLDGEGDGEPLIEPTSHSASLPASFGPASARPAPPPAAAPAPRNMTGPPVDLFAAPEDAGEMELALDVVERGVPASAGGATVAPAAPRGTMAPPPEPVAAPRPPAKPIGARVRELLASVRIRFAAGVIAAVVLGFIPAHIVAHIREGAAFAEVDDKLEDRYAAVQSADDYAALDKARARALDRKSTERRDIALTALVIWAAAGAALAYVWFRRVPWDRIARA